MEHQSRSDSCPSQRWCGSALGNRARNKEHRREAGAMVGEQSEMRFAAEVRMRSRWSSSLARCTGSHVCHASVLKRAPVQKIDAACLTGLGLSR